MARHAPFVVARRLNTLAALRAPARARQGAAALGVLLVLALPPSPVEAQSLVAIEQIAAAGGALVGPVWGPPLVAAHGRRLEVYSESATGPAAPIGIVPTHARIVALAAADGRAYLVTSDDGRSSKALGVDLSDPRRPRILFRHDGRVPPSAVAMSGEHVWLGEAGGRVSHLSWPHGGTPTRTDTFPLDPGTGLHIERLQADGAYALASARVASGAAGRSFALAASSEGEIVANARLSPGRATLTGGSVVVHPVRFGVDDEVRVWPLHGLAEGYWTNRAMSWTPPPGDEVVGVAVVGDRLWLNLRQELGGVRTPQIRMHVVVWSLRDRRQVADVPLSIPSCAGLLAVHAGGTEGEAGWVACHTDRRVGFVPHVEGVPGRDAGRWLDMRRSEYVTVRPVRGGAWVMDRDTGLVALSPRGARMPGSCAMRIDHVLATDDRLVGVYGGSWWTAPLSWPLDCAGLRWHRPRGALARDALGAAVAGARIAWSGHGCVGVAWLEQPEEPDARPPQSRPAVGNLCWGRADVVLTEERLYLLSALQVPGSISLMTYDTTRPASPRILARDGLLLRAPTTVVSAAARGDTLVALDSTGRAWSWDVQQPATPRVVTSLDLPTPAVDLALDGRCVWVASTGRSPRLTLLVLDAAGRLHERAAGPLDPATTDVEAGQGRAWTIAAGQVSVHEVTASADAWQEGNRPDCAAADGATWRRFDSWLPRVDRLGGAVR